MKNTFSTGKGSNVMKCFCQDKGVDRVNRRLVGKLEVHAPSSYCPQLEIMYVCNVNIPTSVLCNLELRWMTRVRVDRRARRRTGSTT